MNKKIIHKVSGGKLLKIDVNIENSVILDIKITGDFFIYPEEAIFAIEKFLINKKINDINEQLSKFLLDKNIKIIGFEPSDIQGVLLNN
jgi:lipoate---protein ligase